MPNEVAKQKPPVVKVRAVAVNCPICKNGTSPDYKNVEELAKYITDRARIIGKARSGLCAKHQRRLAKAIKRARYLGLLPTSGGSNL